MNVFKDFWKKYFPYFQVDMLYYVLVILLVPMILLISRC
jgi:hypothetical protein